MLVSVYKKKLMHEGCTHDRRINFAMLTAPFVYVSDVGTLVHVAFFSSRYLLCTNNDVMLRNALVSPSDGMQTVDFDRHSSRRNLLTPVSTVRCV